MSDVRLIFMGTPEFAVPSLEMLISHGHNVVAVVTAPDKPQGRGKKIGQSAVKTLALAHQIPVLQPTNLQDPDFLEELRSYHADMQIVVAFRMLPKAVWAMPRWGTFNLHASLLPDYRGAAPINWAIMNGERETGLTTFLLDQAIDTGNIIFQERTSIADTDTAGTLYERLRHQGAQLVCKTVVAIQEGTAPCTPQVTTPESRAKKAPKIHKADGAIDWNQPQIQVINFVRGLSPYPAAWTVLKGKTYKIIQVAALAEPVAPLAPGDVRSDGKQYLHIGTQDKPVAICALQPMGKRCMTVQEFLNGYNI